VADELYVKVLSVLLMAIPAVAQTTPQTPPSESIKKQLASVAIQREAVRRQTELAAQYRVSPVVAAAGCDPLPAVEITPILDAAAQTHHVQTNLLRAVMEQESASRACAVSAKGAQGLMQLMPAAIEQFQVTDPFDPKQNVDAGAQFLKQLLDKYKGDLSLVLAAYNAGPATVDQAGGIPDIKETKDYVEAILKKLQ
jgi:soluble lytic murein transglycosylase-like protein